MKMPILGGDGLFGHELLRSLSPSHDMRVTLRQPLKAYLVCPRSQGKTPLGA
jgi:dTDP-4-dehydrorhamnose reductase